MKKKFGRPIDVDLQYFFDTGVIPLSLNPWCVEASEFSKKSDIQSAQSGRAKRHHCFVRQKLSLKYFFLRVGFVFRENGVIRGARLLLSALFERY